jgi:hypothetical protein
MKLDTVGTWVAFGLTLLAYAYLGKELPFFDALYRIVAYIFIGVALAYAAVQAWHGVLVPRLLAPLAAKEWFYVVPAILCLILLARLYRPWQGISRLTLAFLFGVGAALAVGGALVGTLMPQVQATFASVRPSAYQARAAQEGMAAGTYVLDVVVIAVGTISTLLYFTFTTARGATPLEKTGGRIQQIAAGFGKVFVLFTFGALFATGSISRVALLVDRVRFLIETLRPYIPGI